MKAWCNGQIGDARECRVAVLDHGLLYGDGVFEGIRISGGRVFRLDDHLARLSRSARMIGLDLPYKVARIRAIVLETARAHGHDEAYVRLLITRGVGELSLDPTLCNAPQLICIVATLNLFAPELREHGVRLMTAAQRRPRADMLDAQVKSLNYLNNVLAKRDARRNGYDDALLLNADGRVAEASGANIFALVEGVLVTPPCTEGALPGITRDTVIRCQRAAGLALSERALSRYDLLNADEAFLSGSGAGLIGVQSLDGVTIGHGQHGTLVRLQAAYAEYARCHGSGF